MVTRTKQVPNRPEADVVGETQAQSEFQEAFASFNEAMNPQSAGVSPIKLMIISVVASLAVYALGAIAGLYLASWLGGLALAATGVTFIAMVIELFVALIAIVAAMLAGSYVAKYIATGQFSEDFNTARGWVARKFSATSTFVKSHAMH